jgi:hypothetical protein
VHAVLGQPLCERLPDAVRRAGDDGDLVFVALGQPCPFFCLSAVVTAAVNLRTEKSWRPKRPLQRAAAGKVRKGGTGYGL